MELVTLKKSNPIRAFFPEETVFWASTSEGNRVDMLIRGGTWCWIEEIKEESEVSEVSEPNSGIN